MKTDLLIKYFEKAKMINKHYHFIPTKSNKQFFFESEGRQGKVIKIVIFSDVGNSRYNLGFGDWHRGQLNDSIITNNYDVALVMQTIAKIVYVFFEQHPDCIIEISPVDEKRKRLYNLIFQRHILTIDTNFQLIGFIGEKSETYSPSKIYDYFELKLKSK